MTRTELEALVKMIAPAVRESLRPPFLHNQTPTESGVPGIPDVGFSQSRCPYCAEEIQDAAIVCKHCSRNLPPSVKPQPTAPANRSAGTRITKIAIWAALPFGAIALVVAIVSGTRGSARAGITDEHLSAI
jgi:hypothetical protein